MRSLKQFLRTLGAALVVLALIGCGSTTKPTPTPTNTQIPTSTPKPTNTPVPDRIHLEADGSGDFATLEQAISNAPEFATITLGPGTYNLIGRLDVKKSVTLVGAGLDKTEIVASLPDYVVFFRGGYGFVVEDLAIRHKGEVGADSVVVSDGTFTFTRCKFVGAVPREGEIEGAGLKISSSAQVVVQNSVFEDNYVGIVARGKSLVTLEENVVTKNQTGIAYADNASGGIRRNQCSENELFGILVVGEAHPFLEENTCIKNGAGIAYMDNSSGWARGNQCSENEYFGIFITSQAQPTLEENICMNNKTGIAYIEFAEGMSRGNQCSSNEDAGISVADQAKPKLIENICSDNGLFGLIVEETTNPELIENDCRGNNKADILDLRE
ncbi:MAG: right-handed parallel beta-helix repeat-containing protein [Anaerolineales bacterium]|nr:right-handed parallel beta-helix repeat-containing protein [Anaerolineales bacterium]